MNILKIDKSLLYKISILLLWLVSNQVLSAQELSYKEKTFSVDYFQDGQEVECKTFQNTLFQNSESEKLWKSAKTSRLMASLSAATAGYGLGGWLRNNSFNRNENKTPFIAMTLGGTILSAVFLGQSKKQQNKAIEVYNGSRSSSNIEIVPSSSGLGFAIQF